MYLVNSGRQFVRADVNDVDAITVQGRHDEAVARLGRVVMATGARVPSGVVDLVADVRQVHPVNHLWREKFVSNLVCVHYGTVFFLNKYVKS